MSIIDWPEDERPREKLLKFGPARLSDAELLAIFLRTGVTGMSAVDLARQMLQTFGSVNGLFAADLERFCSIRGLGAAKYAQLQAVAELSRRALAEEFRLRDVLDSPDTVRNYLRLSLQNRDREVFVVLFLDTRNRVIAYEELFTGTLNQASVHPREVVRRAMHHNAASVILAHNHPSGVAQRSDADDGLTQILKNALALLDVRVLDHFIVGHGELFSYAERGLL
jgi:DNA repair protein RadC